MSTSDVWRALFFCAGEADETGERQRRRRGVRVGATCSPLLLGAAVLVCLPSAQCYRQHVNVSVRAFGSPGAF